MKTQIFTLLALASSAHLATATFDWLDAKKFTSPANTDNKCIPKQKGGFNWEGLNLGKFKDFSDFEFDGFECADSFDGKTKRDLITGRTFQNKCIKGKATEDKSTAPGFGCGSSKQVEKFSVKEFQVSVEYDTDLEFHYDMPDGTTCKQKKSCKKSGTIVKNTQCGGAKKVKVTVPKGKGKGKDKGCNIGFHHIDFDCEPPKTPIKTPKPTPTPTPETTPVPETTPLPETTPTSPAETDASETPSPTPEVSETPSETEAIPITTPIESTTTTASPVESTNPPFPVNTTTIPAGGETEPPVTHPATTILSTSVFTETRTNTITSCAEQVISCPAESTVITTETAVSTTVIPVTTTHAPEPTTVISVEHTTVIVETSTTICPVTSTFVDNGVTTIQTTLSTSTILISSTATIPVVSTPVESSPVTTTTTPSAPLPTADCPALLPQCLNTWVEVSGCKSNTDVECFCKSADFVENVYQCLIAHSASDEEVDKAQSFFQGICAVHIPENPAIITDVNTLTITASHLPTTVPVTTIELQTTIIVPCTETAGPSSGSLIPGSSTTQVISTAVTVPQVVFETITGTSTNVVSLVQGTPTAPAATSAVLTTFTTPLIISPTTFASVPAPFVNSTTTAAPPTFTGAASKNGLTAGSLVVAGFVALMAL